MYEEVTKELYLIKDKIYDLEEEYRKKVKGIASSCNTSSEDLLDIYYTHINETYEDNHGYVIEDRNLKYDLENELSKNINTPNDILFEIAYCVVYTSDVFNNVLDTITQKSLLIAKNIKSTTEELNDAYFLINEIDETLDQYPNTVYMALAQHTNTDSSLLNSLLEYKNLDMYMNILKHKNITPKILDKMSCIYDDVDALILKHSQATVKTKKKINKKRGCR